MSSKIKSSDWQTAATVKYEGTETVEEILDDTINCGVLNNIVITDEGGINISWAAGTLWDCVSLTVITIDAHASTACSDNNINYLYWDRSGGGTALTLSTTRPNYTDNDVLVGIIVVQSNDIYEIHTTNILSQRENDTTTAIRDILRVVVTDGLIVSEDVDATNAFDVQISAGTFYHFGTTRHNLSASFNTRTTAMTRWYHASGVWTNDSNAQIDMTEGTAGINRYDNLTDRVDGAANKYYKSMFMYSENMIHWIYPQVEYDTIAQAIAAPLPTIPSVGEFFPRSVSVVMKGNDAAFPTAGGTRWIDIRPLFGTSITGIISDHGNLAGLGDDDHTQYILHSLADTASDFLIASGNDTFVKQSLAATGAILEADIDHGNIQGLSTGADHSYINQDVTSGSGPAFTSIQLTTPVLGTPTSGTLTNCDGTASGLTAGAVTNATLTTALTVNTGTLTLTADVGNDSVLTIGGGAVSVSGSNTGDQDLSGYALVGQTFYIGTTQVAINRASAALTLAGIILTTPEIGAATGTSLTNSGDLTLASTGAGVNINTHTDAGDDFAVNTSMLVVSGDTGAMGFGTATPTHIFDIECGGGYLRVADTYAHIIQHNNNASTYWTLAPRDGGHLDISVLGSDPTTTIIAASNTVLRIDSTGKVSIGANLTPLAKLHIDQATNDAAIPVLSLDQADISDGFINFIGSDRGVIAAATASLKSVRVELAGVIYRLALYVDA